MSVKKTQPGILRRVVEDGKEVWIDIWSTTGRKTIACADDVFIGGISSKFVDWNLDVRAWPTLKARAAVYDLIAPATAPQMFARFERLYQGVSVTQHQIVQCVARNQGMLFYGDVFGVFFLLRHGNGFGSTFFPVYVSRELRATIRPLISSSGTSRDTRIWDTTHPRRVIVLE